jgi:hypothetical protein
LKVCSVISHLTVVLPISFRDDLHSFRHWVHNTMLTLVIISSSFFYILFSVFLSHLYLPLFLRSSSQCPLSHTLNGLLPPSGRYPYENHLCICLPPLVTIVKPLVTVTSLPCVICISHDVHRYAALRPSLTKVKHVSILRLPSSGMCRRVVWHID